MSERFRIRQVSGDPGSIEKSGDPEALAREVAALTLLGGRAGAPDLVEHAHGRMVSSRLPGAPRTIAAVGASEARRLGALVREAHDARRAASGGLWWWPAPADSLAGYRRRRAEDTERALAGGPHAGLADRACDASDGADGPDGDASPFRMLHGDLVESNVVWGPDGPGLVNWEFWRMGDPAEDLAYLVETNSLPDRLVGPLLNGYALPGMGERMRRWRALVAADAGAWYLSEGFVEESARLLARARALC